MASSGEESRSPPSERIPESRQDTSDYSGSETNVGHAEDMSDDDDGEPMAGHSAENEDQKRSPESHEDEEGSRSPPSERLPESHDDASDSPDSEPVARPTRPQIPSDDDEETRSERSAGMVKRKTSDGQELDDIDLSDSEGEEDEGNKDFTEDDIVGPRLYADPDTQEDEPDTRPPTIVEVNTARIDPSFTSSGLYFVKLPNFLSVDTRPFDQDHYEDEIDEDEYLDEEGRARLKLKVENTLRWRYKLDEQGNLAKQSNAKIIRWSDGTMSLKLGNELFDVQCQPMQRDNHLFMRQGAGLQGHAVFSKKLVFRPFSTDSITHRKVTLSMADRTSKSQKLKVLNTVGQDPEAQKAEMVRKEEERLRAQTRREAQQRRSRVQPIRAGLSASYLEDHIYESEGEEGISSIKRRYKAAAFDDAPIIGRSDSEESDSQRLNEAQKDSDESDSEQELRTQRKKKVIIEEEED